MSGINDKATVTLQVNGEQAKTVMADVEKKIKATEQAIIKLKKSNADPKDIEKQRKLLRTYQKQLDEMRSATEGVNKAFKSLDTATPRQLEKTLKTLKKQLKDLKPGTAVWDEHTKKIQQASAQLKVLKQQIQGQESLWQRFSKWWYQCGQAVAALIAGYQTLISTLRGYVNDYASMEEQMANTMKFTGLSKQEVKELNESFKALDTRTPREKLNELAQEAGRLGKNTKESVQGYVEAADIINVALVDLGQGATQEIAKLTNIFDVEEAYGTRDAMLKVGSTVNVLSQNCTASKPYIVEFTKRLAGVGSQAKMTIPEIMAFAATLDANGQAVEMSASALSRTIMMLFQKPKEIAKTVGLDVEEFTKTLQRNTTEGLMMFFGALQKMGKEDALAALSPLFKDLGMDGVRMSTVLATVANKLEMVKWEMGEANKAFEEGSSATREYIIFNNTAQATIDKAKKKIHELSVELGEKLYPLMAHLTSSGSAALKVLNVLIDGIIKFRGVLTIAIVTIGSYYAWIGLCKAAIVGWNLVTKASIAIQGGLRASLMLGRIALLAFTGQITKARHAFQLLNTVIKTNYIGLLISLLAGLVAIISKLVPKADEFKTKMKEAVTLTSSYNKELEKEKRELDELFGALEGATEGSNEFNKAKKKLLEQYGSYLQGLIDEKGRVVDLEAAYHRLSEAIRIANQERGIKNARDAVESNYSEQMEEFSKELHNTLIDYGVTVREATKLTQRVVTSMSMHEAVDAETVARINEITASGRVADDGQSGWGAKLAYNGSASLNFLTGGILGTEIKDSPAELVNKMYQATDVRNQALNEIDVTARLNRPLRDLEDSMLDNFIAYAEKAVKSGGGSVLSISDALAGTAEMVEVDLNEARRLLEEFKTEKAYRTGAKSPIGTPDLNDGNGDGYTSAVLSAKEKRRQELEVKRELAKANLAYRDRMEGAKGDWEAAKAENVVNYSQGLITYEEYIAEKERIDLKYIEDRIAIYNDLYKDETAENKNLLLKYDEDYQELLLRKAELEKKHEDERHKRKIATLKREQKAEENAIKLNALTPENELYGNEMAQQEQLYQVKMKYLRMFRDAYKKGSKEWLEYERQISDAESARMFEKRKMYVQKLEEWRKGYEFLSLKKRMDMELKVLDELHNKKLISEEEYLRIKADLERKYQTETNSASNGKVDYLSNSEHRTAKVSSRNADKAKDLEELKYKYDQGLIDEKRYQQGRRNIEKYYTNLMYDDIRSCLDDQTKMLFDLGVVWADFFRNIANGGRISFEDIGSIAMNTFAVMSAGLEMYGEFASAQSRIEIANTQKKYDKEIEAMQGNTYKTAKLEKKRDAEIAKLKAEATKKEFNIKVAQAVAQTAQNALAAYGAGLQAGFPMALWLAPTLAGLATATGLVQIALLKKQQKAAEAEGYAEGGFTKPGSKYEPAGIVHAGEWVASQKLLANPSARALIEQLDYVQRTNTIGSLKSEDVSMAITAPQSLARIMEGDASSALMVAAVAQSAEAVKELSERLKEPIAAITTVTGPYGVNKAQEEYATLLRNITPKAKHK
ncbi:MAG: phage tail tape measure protein [Muribaculaceae bacterium]|nr:phage tail tape measure protein [Muribaculaceae bacterium]